MFCVQIKKESSPHEAANNKNNHLQYIISALRESNIDIGLNMASVVSGYAYAKQHPIYQLFSETELNIFISVYEDIALLENNGHALGMAVALKEMMSA